MYIGIEMGGTKVIVAKGTGPQDLSTPIRLPTLDPDTTLRAMIETVKTLSAGETLTAIGVASFGPIGVDPKGAGYGVLRPTPKLGWSGFDLYSGLKAAFGSTPIVIDTDVNGAAMGEFRWGGAQGLSNFAYVTIGTGIGVGVVSGGQPVHGLLHPEAGHIRIQRDLSLDPYAGRCPFHGDCLEGVAAGPSVFDRTGVRGEDLAADHYVWPLIGRYLAELYANLTLIASPQRILVGGGVGLKPEVLSASRQHLLKTLGGYVEALNSSEAIEPFVTAAQLGDRAGVLGAIALAQGV